MRRGMYVYGMPHAADEELYHRITTDFKHIMIPQRRDTRENPISNSITPAIASLSTLGSPDAILDMKLFISNPPIPNDSAEGSWQCPP